MGESMRIEVRNTRDAIAPATQQAEAWLLHNQIGSEATYLVLLAIEELVTNCIKYGYGDAADHVIAILLSVEDSTLRMEIVDDGDPFDPLNAPPPDLLSDINNREEGGLGIYLLRELSDNRAYERRDGANHLTLTKHLS